MFCKNCGANLPEGSMFCGSCGAKFDEPHAASPTPPQHAYATQATPVRRIPPATKKSPIMLVAKAAKKWF